MALQLVIYFIRIYPRASRDPALREDAELQSRIDLLKTEYSKSDSLKIYPFNPNYISDYKGYVLGMSPQEIDRLHRYRSGDKFVNSAEEFQQVTLVPDSLLALLAPYFKFPDWVREPIPGSGKSQTYGKTERTGAIPPKSESLKTTVGHLDLNRANEEDLRAIYGVGDKLSGRIVRFRDRLGGFLVEEQLGHVYGLDQGVVDRILERFRIHEPPQVVKININKASAVEIARLIYINYRVAQSIVAHREAQGALRSFDELTGIEDFPSEKIDIIQLYLQL